MGALERTNDLNLNFYYLQRLMRLTVMTDKEITHLLTYLLYPVADQQSTVGVSKRSSHSTGHEINRTSALSVARNSQTTDDTFVQ